MNIDKRLRRVRILLFVFVVILVLSGVTAFPLVWEIRLLESMVGEGSFAAKVFPRLSEFITSIHEGVEEVNIEQAFMFYGTDWLAFGHIAIAIFFIGAIVDPVRNIWIIEAGMIACVLVLPAAFICGPIRGIPFFWQLIDCSFGVIGVVPLWIVRQKIRRIEAEQKEITRAS